MIENRYKSKKQQKKFQEKVKKSFNRKIEVYEKKKIVAKKYKIGYNEIEIELSK